MKCRRHRRFGDAREAVRSGSFTLVATALAGCAAPTPVDRFDGVALLRGVDSWAVQLQGVESDLAQRDLERARVDLVVLEPTRSVRGMEAVPMREIVAAVQRSAGATLPTKRCVAYLDIGQAEDYRCYWSADWRAPDGGPGSPDFVLGLDPEGWVGNYPVSFWDERWRALLWGRPEAPLDQILADGFDGVYLDWVLGCFHPMVVAAAERDGVDAAAEMVALIRDVRAYARARNPLFVVIAQNAVDLAERRPELVASVDAFAQEDLSFRGSATAAWDDPGSGGVPAPAQGPYSTPELGARLAALVERGIPVLTLDYAVAPDDARAARRASRSFGCIPCVSRTPLDRLPEELRAAP